MVPRKSMRFASVWIPVVTSLLATTSIVRADELLRWKFSPGDVLRYELTQNMKQNVEANGNTFEMLLDQIYNLSWTVEDIDAQRNARITFQFERIRFNMTGVGGLRFAFDSASPEKQPENPAFKPIADALNAVLTTRFSFSVDPLGKLSDMKGAEQLKELLPDGPASQFFSKDSIEQTAGQGFVRFASEAIAQGGGWQKQYDLQMPQLGKVVGTEDYTLEGTATLEGRRCLRIVSKSNVEIVPEANGQLAELGAQFDIQPVDSTYWFDNQAGRLLQSQSSQRMQITFKLGTIHMEMNVTIRLLPDGPNR